MKLTFILLTACIMEASAISHAQTVSLIVKDISLKKVFTLLKRQSGYEFLYNANTLKGTHGISLNVKDVTIRAALDQCFADQPVTYLIDGKTIIVKDKAKTDVILNETPVLAVSIAGTVKSGTGETLPGVTVKLKGTTTAVATDNNGRYKIAIPDNNGTLVFSYLGYVTQEVAVNGRTTIDVQLKDELKSLNDAVVVGYATQKKVSVTSAVGVIKSEDISRRPVTNTTQSLQGLSPGVTILDQGGAPGRANVTARIRGITTLSGNNPLVLVDGIEQSINNLNPDDIESVSILKDAAATSIYGSRAATGVLLITTKRGKAGDLSVTYNGYAGIQQLGIHPTSIGTVDYFKLENVAYANAGRPQRYSDELIAAYSSDAASDHIKYPLANDWFSAIYHNALQYNNNFSISGGSDKFKGLVNVRDFQQNGIADNFSNNIREIRLNTDFKASEKFKFNFDANYRKVFNTQPQDAFNVYYNTLHGAQLTVPRYPDGGYGISAQGNSPLVSDKLSGFDNDNFDNVSVNLRGEWTILKGLKFSTQYGVTSTFDVGKIFTNSYNIVDENVPARTRTRAVNSLTENRTNTYLETINDILTYNVAIKQSTFNLLAGYSQIFNSASNLTAFRNTFYNNSIQALGQGSSGSKDNGGSDVSSGLRSYFGRLNYDFAGKYLLEANGRYDGSSNFTGKNLYSFFPSFSAGWRVSQENFWKPLSGVVQEFKLRGSWGKTGNQTVSPYSFYEALSTQNYNFTGAAATGYALQNYANTDIKWETTRQTDIGFDASLFNSKFDITFDYYDKLTSGILLSLPISGAVGLNAPVQNAGVVSNKGWELGINYRDMGHPLKYSFNFNVSNNINKVLDLKGTGPYINGSTNDGLYATNVGLPINALWGFKTAGLFKDAADVANTVAKYDPNTYPGDIKYVDINHDGKITADDRTQIGDEFPHYTFGLTTTLQYKNFDAYIFLQGALKQDARVSGALADAGNNEGFVIDIENDYWTSTNTDARFPRPQKNTDKNAQISDFWVVHMGYIRAKNLQLGYTLPKLITKALSIKKLRLYLSGTNLLTISNANKWGIDPEFPTGRLSYYPQTKVYTLGANVTF
jgi:TonB-linked SusC/RagA family outer membrane protein